MNNQQFSALAYSEHGKRLTEYIEKLIKDITDIRNIEEINEVEIAAHKKAADILEEYLLDPLKLDRNQAEPPVEAYL